MSTTIPKDGLRTLVASLADLSEEFIVWDGEPMRPVDFSEDAKRLILNIVARRAIGEDEEKREYVFDPPNGMLLKRTFSGQRSVTISIRAEDFGDEEGFDFLERIRTLLGADESRLVLNALGLALARTEDVHVLPGTAGNRAISVASMDVVVNQRVETIVTTTGDTYIETVETTGDDELVIAGTDLISS